MLGAGLFQRLIDSSKHLSSSLLETIVPGHKLKIDNSQPQTMLDTESKHAAETTQPLGGEDVDEEDELSIQTIPYEINRYECECSECGENCDQDCTDEDVTDFLPLHRHEIERMAQNDCSSKSGTTLGIEVKDRVFMEQVNFGQRKDDEQDGKYHSEIQSLTRIRQQSNSQVTISKNIAMNSTNSTEQDTKLKVPLCEYSERIVGRIDYMSENKQQSEHEMLSQTQPDSNASLNITNAGLDMNKGTEQETPIKPKRLLYLHQENSGILPSSAQSKSQSQFTSQQPLIPSDATVSKKKNSMNVAIPILYSSDDEEMEWVHVNTTKKLEDEQERAPMTTCSDQGTGLKALHSKIEQAVNLKDEIQMQNISSVMDKESNRDAIIGTKCTAPSPSEGNCSTPSASSRVQSEPIQQSVNTAKRKTWINNDISMLDSSDDEKVSPRGNCAHEKDSKKVEFNQTITNAKDPKDPGPSKRKVPDAKGQTSSKGKEPASTDRTLNEATLSHPNKSSNCAETDVICLDGSGSDSTIDLLESSSSDEIIIFNESNSRTHIFASSSIQKQGRDRKRKRSPTTSSNVEVVNLCDNDVHEALRRTPRRRKKARKHSLGSRPTPSRHCGEVIELD